MKNVLTYSTISETQFKEIIGNQVKKPFLVVFTADWLGEGTIMDTIMGKVAAEFDEEVNFFRIDVDSSPDIIHQLGIRRLPSIYFFKDGEIVDHFAGMKSRKSVEERVKKVF